MTEFVTNIPREFIVCSSDCQTLCEGEERGMENFERVMEHLPKRLSLRIIDVCSRRRDFPLGLSEIRIRRYGAVSLVISGKALPLGISATSEEMEEIFHSLTKGGLHYLRDGIADGYISLGGGIRVGVGGSVYYEGGECAGVSEVCVLAFRMPSVKKYDCSDVYELFMKNKGGMLIFSPPGGGKTTLIKNLARHIGASREPLCCVVVDERREFVPSDYSGLTVDILSGYKKSAGIDIAKRTLGAEVIIVDEVSGKEACAILDAAGVSVPVIATYHAADLPELFCDSGISELVRRGVFSSFVKIEQGSFKRTFYSCADLYEHNK